MDYAHMAGKLRKLGHPDRLRILEYLSESPEPIPVEAMASDLDIRQSTLSQHLHELREAGLVAFDEQGSNAFKVHRYYSLFRDMAALSSLVGAA